MTLFYEHIATVLFAFAIVLVGLLLANMAKSRMMKSAKRSQDPTVHAFLANCAYLVLIALVIITGLALLGVPTTALITVLGAASLAVGLAMKEFLSNVAAGFLLIFLRPFKVGDTITVLNNITGKVIEINLFVTQIDTITNDAIFVPNSQLVNGAIVNKTRYPLRQIDLRITVSGESDILKAKTILEETAKQHPAIHSTPAPFSAVAELNDNNVTLFLRAWIDSSDSKIQFELNEAIKKALIAENISLPTPQMEVVIKPSQLREINDRA